MTLQEIHFGIPNHGWMTVKFIGVSQIIEYDISDVPIDPFIGISHVVDDIKNNMIPRDLIFNLEPSELKLEFKNGSLNVYIDGKNLFIYNRIAGVRISLSNGRK